MERLEHWAARFAIRDQMIFLNHAGVAPLAPPAAEALTRYTQEASQFSYTRSDWYQQASNAKAALARLIGAAGPHEIAFIPNTSAGLNLVARGLTWRPGDEVVSTAVEFPANRYVWQDLNRLGVTVRLAPQQPDGRIDVDDVLDLITDRTRVVALSHVQYGNGFRCDLARISRELTPLRQRGRGFLCVDGIQAVGALPVDVQALGVDFLAADGHKWLLASEGAGLFYCRAELAQMLHPNVVGWLNMTNPLQFDDYRFEFADDARRFEPGTYNIPGILALGASAEMFLDLGMATVWQRLEQLTERLGQQLTTHGWRVCSPRQPHERSGIISFLPPPPEVSHDSRQAPGAPPAVLNRYVSGLRQREIHLVARAGRLRASPHFYNRLEDMDQLVAALEALRRAG